MSGLTTAELTNTTLVDKRKYRAADNQFGIVSKGNRISTSINDGSGHTATFSMTGPGVATFTTAANGVNLTLTGTTAKTTLNVAGAAGFRIDHITSTGAVGGINAAGVNLSGGLSILGSLKTIVIASATGGAWAVRNGIDSIQISGALASTQIFSGWPGRMESSARPTTALRRERSVQYSSAEPRLRAPWPRAWRRLREKRSSQNRCCCRRGASDRLPFAARLTREADSSRRSCRRTRSWPITP